MTVLNIHNPDVAPATPTQPATPANESPGRRLRREAGACRVRFTWWGVSRALTSEQKEESAAAHNADAKLLSASKKIVDIKHPAFKAMSEIRGRIRAYWNGITLPYVEAGTRLIKRSDIDTFVHTMEGFREELREAENNLNNHFAELRAQAQARLGNLYDPTDYPVEVRGLFDVEWDFPSVEPPAYLMNLAPAVYEAERQRVAARFEEAVHLAEQAFAAEFAKALEHLTERLRPNEDGTPRVFRDSAVANLRDFFERFRHLNVTGADDLDRLVRQAQGMLGGVDAQDLRDNAALRQTVASQMAAVLNGVEGLIVDAPRRKIIKGKKATP